MPAIKPEDFANPFRVYDASECGSDGYPFVWHENDGSLDGLLVALIKDGYGKGLIGSGNPRPGLKHIVRAQAGHRCLRCRHPFLVGESGVMEGPQAMAKAFAADLGVDIEFLDTLILENALPLPPAKEQKALEGARRINWSACDEECRHGGPIRWRSAITGDWHERDPRDDDLQVHEVELMLREISEVQAAWRILTVHHLDEVKANLRWWNLVALCQRCHLLIQRKVTMDNPWPWEHSDWFKPYAAGFYAQKYLGLDASREEVDRRQDALLALGEVEESVERMPL